jgi:hypothetical protein
MDEHEIAADAVRVEIGERAAQINVGVLDNAPTGTAQDKDQKSDQGNW